MEQCRFSGLPQSTAATIALLKPKAAALVSSDASASAVSASWSDADAVVGRLDAEAVVRGWFIVASWSGAGEGSSPAQRARPDAVGAIEPSPSIGGVSDSPGPEVKPDVLW